jgi:hypothetical protein
MEFVSDGLPNITAKTATRSFIEKILGDYYDTTLLVCIGERGKLLYSSVSGPIGIDPED